MSEMDDLAAFAVLMESGSFTAAAERLGFLANAGKATGTDG